MAPVPCQTRPPLCIGLSPGSQTLHWPARRRWPAPAGAGRSASGWRPPAAAWRQLALAWRLAARTQSLHLRVACSLACEEQQAGHEPAQQRAINYTCNAAAAQQDVCLSGRLLNSLAAALLAQEVAAALSGVAQHAPPLVLRPARCTRCSQHCSLVLVILPVTTRFAGIALPPPLLTLRLCWVLVITTCASSKHFCQPNAHSLGILQHSIQLLLQQVLCLSILVPVKYQHKRHGGTCCQSASKARHLAQASSSKATRSSCEQTRRQLRADGWKPAGGADYTTPYRT